MTNQPSPSKTLHDRLDAMVKSLGIPSDGHDEGCRLRVESDYCSCGLAEYTVALDLLQRLEEQDARAEDMKSRNAILREERNAANARYQSLTAANAALERQLEEADKALIQALPWDPGARAHPYSCAWVVSRQFESNCGPKDCDCWLSIADNAISREQFRNGEGTNAKHS